jgi:hypothetical protein
LRLSLTIIFCLSIISFFTETHFICAVLNSHIYGSIVKVFNTQFSPF